MTCFISHSCVRVCCADDIHRRLKKKKEKEEEEMPQKVIVVEKPSPPLVVPMYIPVATPVKEVKMPVYKKVCNKYS
jgi:hypothetical protein